MLLSLLRRDCCGSSPCWGEDRLLSWLGRDLVSALLVRERLGVCSPCWGEAWCLLSLSGRDLLFALRVRKGLVRSPG